MKSKLILITSIIASGIILHQGKGEFLEAREKYHETYLSHAVAVGTVAAAAIPATFGVYYFYKKRGEE